MMSIEQIKEDAAIAADQMNINWKELENPSYRKDFETVLKRAMILLPDLEGLYVKLSAGKSVMNPDEDTPLSFDDVEKYSELVEEELFNGYILQSLYHKYTAVENVIKASLDNPE